MSLIKPNIPVAKLIFCIGDEEPAHWGRAIPARNDTRSVPPLGLQEAIWMAKVAA